VLKSSVNSLAFEFFWVVCLIAPKSFDRVFEFCLTNLHLKHHKLFPLSACIIEYSIEFFFKFGQLVTFWCGKVMTRDRWDDTDLVRPAFLEQNFTSTGIIT